MQVRILWVEGNRADSPLFVPGLRKKGFVVEIAATGNEALARLEQIDPDLVVINAASMRSSGKRIARALREKANGVPIVVIAESEAALPADLNADVALAMPFTQRKLLNRITPLLPGKETHLLHTGPIRLDMERKRVRVHGRESSLTPRLAQLLKVFMEHPGEALEREQLFRDVWETEYTADTRTLDVHISWLRHAIEEDPRQPRYLKTIRGVGYRLDV